jgi:hypothetical protein
MKTLKDSYHEFTTKRKMQNTSQTLVTTNQKSVVYKKNKEEDSDFYPLIVFYCNDPTDMDSSFKTNKDWILLNRHTYQDDFLATLGRSYLCLLISDLLVFNWDIDMLEDFICGALYSMSDTQESQVIAISNDMCTTTTVKDCNPSGLSNLSGPGVMIKTFKKTKKNPEKCTKWIHKHYRKLWKKKLKVKKNKMFCTSMNVYLKRYLETDLPIKKLYFSQPRVRILIDSLLHA